MSEQDTREQLEAWAHEEIAEKWAKSDREVTMIMDDLLDMLDRQEAITTAECTSEDESFCEACRAAQKRKIAELTAERDELQAAIDAMGNGQFYAMYKAKCEECEEAVSFAKRLENEVNSSKPVTLFGVDYFTAEGMCEECANMYLHETKALDKQNKKLLAEHERLLKKLKRLRRRLAKAKKERDYLQKVVRTQADSFKKLEIELAGKL